MQTIIFGLDSSAAQNRQNSPAGHGLNKISFAYNFDYVDFLNFQKSNFAIGKFLKFRSSINLTRGHVISHTKFRSIGSAVLTFIGYKQTNTQTSKVDIIDRK